MSTTYQLGGSTHLIQARIGEGADLTLTWYDTEEGADGDERDLSSGWTGTVFVLDEDGISVSSFAATLGSGVGNVDASLSGGDTGALDAGNYSIVIKMEPTGGDPVYLPDEGDIQLTLKAAL